MADSVLGILSSEGGIDEYGERILRCLFGQGLPAVTFVSQVSTVKPVQCDRQLKTNFVPKYRKSVRLLDLKTAILLGKERVLIV